MKRLASGALLMALVAVLAAGCGGGGSKALSKEEYGSQLNKICQDANADRKKAGTISSPADVVKKGPKLLAAFDRLISRAEKLKPPDEIKTDTDKVLSEAKQLRDLVSQVIDAAKANDVAKVVQLGAEGDALTKDLDALGTKLGAPACAQG